MSSPLLHGRQRIRLFAAIVGVVALSVTGLAGVAGPAEAIGYGPSVMWSPPAGGPETGAFYARAMSLRHSGSANGTMLSTFEQGTSGTPVFPIFRSTDAGKTWNQISRVRDTARGMGLRYQPFLYELPQRVGHYPAGTIMAAGNSIPNDMSQTHIDIYASTDHGTSWRYVSEVASGGRAVPNNGETPVWEPFLLAANNKLVVYYADQRDPAYGQKVVHQASKDAVHWGSVVNDVTSPKYPSRPGMPTVAQLADGRYILTYENYDYKGPEAAFAVYYRIAANPEDFASAPAQVVRTTDNVVAVGTPYVTWLPTGGPQGTIVLSAISSQDLFVNTHGGAPDGWTHVSSRVSGGYSRALVPMVDGTSVFVITAGFGSGSGDYSVHYGAVDLGGGIEPDHSYQVSTLTDSGTWKPLGAALFQLQANDYYTITTAAAGRNGHGEEWAVTPSPAGGFTITNRVTGKCFTERANDECRFTLK